MIWGGQNKSKQITLLSDFFYSLNWISPPNDLRKWTSFSKIVRCCCQVQNVLIGYDDSYWFGKYTLGSKKEDFYFMARLYFLSTIKKQSTSTQSSHEISLVKVSLVKACCMKLILGDCLFWIISDFDPWTFSIITFQPVQLQQPLTRIDISIKQNFESVHPFSTVKES